MVINFIISFMTVLSINSFPDTLIRNDTFIKYKNYQEKEWVIQNDLFNIKEIDQTVFFIDPQKKDIPEYNYLVKGGFYDYILKECFSMDLGFLKDEDFDLFIKGHDSIRIKYPPKIFITGKLPPKDNITTYIVYFIDELNNKDILNRRIFLLTVKENRTCSLIKVAKCLGLFGSFFFSYTEKINNNYYIKDGAQVGDVSYSDEAWEELKKTGKPINEIKYSEFRINEDGYLEFVK